MNLVHPKIVNKLKNINYETMNNFIFYGPNGSGKSTLVKLLLEIIFKKPITTRPGMITLKKKDIKIFISPFHYEIFLDQKKYDKVLITQLLEHLTQSKSINDKYKIIYFKNAHFLSEETFSFIKNSIETKGNYIKYIFTTNNFSIIKYSSLFFTIRVPLPTVNTILNIVGKEHETLVIEQNRNLTRIFFLLKYNKKSFSSKKKINEIIELIQSGNINKLEKLRALIYDIFSKNYNKNTFLKEIFYSIIPKTIEIIEKTVDISRMVLKSYKDTIHIESYCVYLLLHYNRLQHL